MDYYEINKKYIENLLNKCVKIKIGNKILFITNDNIIRQLKYNNLLKEKKEIKVDLNKINFKDSVILEHNIIDKYFDINYKIYSYFKLVNKSIDYIQTCIRINNILCDIFKVNNYNTYCSFVWIPK